MHEFERHIEHSELLETTLNNRAVNKLKSIEEEVEKKIILITMFIMQLLTMLFINLVN